VKIIMIFTQTVKETCGLRDGLLLDIVVADTIPKLLEKTLKKLKKSLDTVGALC